MGNRYCLDKAYEIIGCLTLATGRLLVEEELEILNEYKPNIFSDVSFGFSPASTAFLHSSYRFLYSSYNGATTFPHVKHLTGIITKSPI